MLVRGFEGHSDTVMYHWPSYRGAFFVGSFVLLPSLSRSNAHSSVAINFLEAAFCGGEIFMIYFILPDVYQIWKDFTDHFFFAKFCLSDLAL